MIDQTPTLVQLIKLLQQIPYLASKNVYRVAHYFLVQDTEKIDQLCQALKDIKEHIIQCTTCGVWKERLRSCWICQVPERNQAIVCVVETWHELLAVEKTGGFQGSYHVLGGAISPLDGIGPEQLMIGSLLERIQSGTIQEIILALNQTPEGEATATYLAQKVRKTDPSVKISCLARGVPVGASLEYTDRLTIFKALSERRLF